MQFLQMVSQKAFKSMLCYKLLYIITITYYAFSISSCLIINVCKIHVKLTDDDSSSSSSSEEGDDGTDGPQPLTKTQIRKHFTLQLARTKRLSGIMAA